jgi:hypothetical protein
VNESTPRPPKKEVDLDFELPDPEGFASIPPRVSLEMILKLSEERLPFVTTRPGFHERRLAEKVDVPFEL